MGARQGSSGLSHRLRPDELSYLMDSTFSSIPGAQKVLFNS
jgi:hypothetical protein